MVTNHLLLTSLALLLITAIAAPAQTQPASPTVQTPDPLQPKPGNPLPAGLKVSAELDQMTATIGENPLIHFTVKNDGIEPFAIRLGGDSRGSPRPLRFIVHAVDDKGNLVEDPYPNPTCFGGMSGTTTLKPGESYEASVPLMRYCRFKKPGTYIITIAHDLGWFPSQTFGDQVKPQPDLPKSVTAKLEIKIVEPDQKQAQAVFQKITDLSDDPNATWGKRSQPYRDFAVLRHPLYLPLLLDRVDAGKPEIIEGIASIETPEATAELLKLLTHTDLAKAQAAADLLRQRLPAEGPPYEQWVNTALVKRTWKPDLAVTARTAAFEILARPSDTLRAIAGRLLTITVVKTDLPVLLKNLDRILAANNSPRSSSDDYLDAPAGTEDLFLAAQRCVTLGAAAPTTPKSPAEILLYLTLLDAAPKDRPTGWESLCAAFLESKHPYVRQRTLQSLPNPMPDACRKKLPTLIADPDSGVAMQACDQARKEKDKTCGPPMLEVLKKTKATFVLSNILAASELLGIYPEALEIMAERLDDKDVFHAAVSFLFTTIKGETGTGGSDANNQDNLPAITRRWKQFITDNREKLRAGEKFPIGDAGITEDFIPPGAAYMIDGQYWPPKK